MTLKYPPLCPNENESNDLGKIGRRWNKAYFREANFDTFGGEAENTITKIQSTLNNLSGQLNDAAAPGAYIIAYGDNWKATGQTAITSPSALWLNINGKAHKLKEQVSLDVNSASSWDYDATEVKRSNAYSVGDCVYASAETDAYIYECTVAGTTSSLAQTWPTAVGDTINDGDCTWTCLINPANAANRAGSDFYIYALSDVTLTPKFILSVNSTVPTGYTATNSRKIGGFHCLCADAGDNISDNNNVHPLSGYVAGDILPASVWDLKHRPKCNPEGMAYDYGTDMWYTIYLLSYTGSYATDDLKLVSKYQGITADGASKEIFHGAKFEQVLGTQRMRLPYQREFVAASIGSNQGTNIKGSADVTTTGGHVDTAGRRMISNIGLEDCCGFLDQWGADVWGSYTNAWANHYDGNDRYVQGQIAQYDKQILLGGSWGGNAHCGSRSADWSVAALAVAAFYGARGASEPLGA